MAGAGPHGPRTRALLHWYARRRRPLPWRRDRDPYRIWVAEVLLQQTRVEQALPYYVRFLRRFPTVRALARAPRGVVLRAWAGAGYYARARHLHAAARWIVRRHHGRLPATVEELERLPGVGPYIARAVASLAFGEPVIALEANGLRVASRWTLERGDPRRPPVRARLAAALAADLPADRPGAFNEAVMELGETVCRPVAPRCGDCPVNFACAAWRALPDPSVLPRRPRRRVRPTVRAAVVVLERDDGRWLLQRRDEKGLLGGMWEFPGGKIERGERPSTAARRELREETGLRSGSLTPLGIVRHAYSHLAVELHAFRGRPYGPHDRLPIGRRWVTAAALERLPLPRATEKVVELVRRTGTASPDSGYRPDRTTASPTAASRSRPARARGRRTRA